MNKGVLRLLHVKFCFPRRYTTHSPSRVKHENQYDTITNTTPRNSVQISFASHTRSICRTGLWNTNRSCCSVNRSADRTILRSKRKLDISLMHSTLSISPILASQKCWNHHRRRSGVPLKQRTRARNLVVETSALERCRRDLGYSTYVT